jgi:hypothetical protein
MNEEFWYEFAFSEGGGEGRQALSLAQRAKFRNEAPMITVFDHRGCKAHTNTEYKGKRAGNQVLHSLSRSLC